MGFISNFKGNQMCFSITTVPLSKPQITQLSYVFQYWVFYLTGNLFQNELVIWFKT